MREFVYGEKRDVCVCVSLHATLRPKQNKKVLYKIFKSVKFSIVLSSSLLRHPGKDDTNESGH